MTTVLKGYLTGYRNTASSLITRMRELESLDYPTALSRALLDTLREAIIASEAAVSALATSGETELENAIVRHAQLLAYIHELVHLVSTSVGSDVPRWAIEPMKFEIGRYLKESVDILIVGTDEGGNFAYDYRLDSLKSVLTSALGEETAKDLVRELPDHMAVFHFPFGERDNVLAHGAFFHEVAHQIDLGIRGISDRVAQEFLASKDDEIRKTTRDLSKKLIEAVRGQQSAKNQRTLEDEKVEVVLETLVKGVQRVLVRWAKEFCADTLATRILGPAYAVVVVISPSLLGNLKAHSVSHPATLLRLKVVLDLLSDTKAGDFLTESGSALDKAGIKGLLEEWKVRCNSADFGGMRWYDHIVDFAPAGLSQAVVNWGLQLGSAVAVAVREESAGQPNYSPSQFTADIEEVMPVLQQWVTINERINYSTRTHSVNEIATIYNVGIACFLNEEIPEERERLKGLLKKSIELSTVQRILNG